MLLLLLLYAGGGGRKSCVENVVVCTGVRNALGCGRSGDYSWWWCFRPRRWWWVTVRPTIDKLGSALKSEDGNGECAGRNVRLRNPWPLE
ncbi:hypothetical protein IWX92DRAFT_378481 [Phyllosticta citricarpa]